MRESEMGKSEIIAQYNFISGIFSPFVEIWYMAGASGHFSLSPHRLTPHLVRNPKEEVGFFFIYFLTDVNSNTYVWEFSP